MTIEIAKGDILGFLVIAVTVGWVGMLLVYGVVVGSLMGGRPRGKDWIPIILALSALSGIGWVLWWLAHWFIRA